MPTIEQVMQGIENRLKTISGLRTSDTSPDTVSPPWAIVGVPPIDNYHATMGRAKFTLEPTVTVVTSTAWNRTGQLKLAAYANPTGAQSVIAAIEADRTLGGTVEDCIVLDFRPTGAEEFGATGYYGGLFTLRVIATGVTS